jgi:hypothetical protein
MLEIKVMVLNSSGERIQSRNLMVDEAMLSPSLLVKSLLLTPKKLEINYTHLLKLHLRR